MHANRAAELAVVDCPFLGQIEVDESYFGPIRMRDLPGRGTSRKTPIFGILERGGRVHRQVAKKSSKVTFTAIIEGRVHLSAEITSDGFRSYDGLVEANSRRHRINDGKALSVRAGVLYKILLKFCRINPLKR